MDIFSSQLFDTKLFIPFAIRVWRMPYYENQIIPFASRVWLWPNSELQIHGISTLPTHPVYL